MGFFNRRESTPTPNIETTPQPEWPDAENLQEGEKPSELAEALTSAALHGANVVHQEDRFMELLKDGRYSEADDVSQGADLSNAAASKSAERVNAILKTPEFVASQTEFNGVLQPGMDSQELADERVKSERKPS